MIKCLTDVNHLAVSCGFFHINMRAGEQTTFTCRTTPSYGKLWLRQQFKQQWWLMLSNSKRETVHFKISATAQCDEHHTGQSLVFKRLLGTGISALVSESLPVRINVEHHKHSCAQESAVVSTLCVMMALQPALPTSPGQWFVAAVSCAQN